MTTPSSPQTPPPPPTDPPAADATLDARDLRCPLPVLRARKALNALAPGQVLAVEASDPASLEDFRQFCAAGAAMLEAQQAEPEAGVFRHWLRRGPA
ncbi:sulfurtransferase TusA family protein [Roseospira marina]|uniref:Sulfurtransferase TusA family protein n=1 Tax=Roseospira marina TaxID=140057 RepID=A0A5M6ICV7_9PROT|nr:sulfurtransferase TusA family protein [Roseospira marina]KAA5606076.1 sulfurtransferase TusA family protein [Roseospira marina]MBB4313058.1 tRNA 2-thiouridine synthesizing protein A [Roseospira marina]MBB5086201.1 tRNA 2-thiouridine synthesizing protein A [Roseospira marina]